VRNRNIVELGLLVIVILVGFGMNWEENTLQKEGKNLEHSGTVSYEDGKIIVDLNDGVGTDMTG